MSLVALGPLIQVVGREGSRRRNASGTVSTTCSARTTQTCVSGTRVSARRPWSGWWSSTIVPVVAIATRQAVTTASMRSSSAARWPVSGTASGTCQGRPGGTMTPLLSRSCAIVSSTRSEGQRVTVAR